jgi:hypothetical protein
MAGCRPVLFLLGHTDGVAGSPSWPVPERERDGEASFRVSLARAQLQPLESGQATGWLDVKVLLVPRGVNDKFSKSSYSVGFNLGTNH